MSELLSNQADTCQTKLTKNAYPNFTKSQVSQIDYHDGIETLLLQHFSTDNSLKFEIEILELRS